MDIHSTSLPGVQVVIPKVLSDTRGCFFESYNRKALHDLGIPHDFVQDNHSFSVHGVLRGLHYQVQHEQGKLVRAASGVIFDVAVDIRADSPAFGKWIGITLSAENRKMLWVPPGLAHGFLVISESADVIYKTTDYYAPQFERTLIWNDQDIRIDWPLKNTPILSEKDRTGIPFRDILTANAK